MSLIQYRPGGGSGVVGTTKGASGIGPMGPTGATGATGPTATVYTTNYASAYSTSDQPFTANIAQNVRHDVVSMSNGITVTTGANGFFKVPSTGIYKIIPSVQMLGSNNGSITIWIKVNGTTLSDSATLTHYKTGDESVITCEYLLSLSANDEVQIWAVATTTTFNINYIPGGGVAPNDYPAAPGVITNMYQIA
jgi:hypothetical protein